MATKTLENPKVAPKAEKPKAKATTARKLAELADAMFTLREERYALQRRVEELHKHEGEIKATLLAEIPLTGATGVSGKLAAVKVVEKKTARVFDWTALYAHVETTGNFELLQRRVSEAAVKERWAEDEDVPGVECAQVFDLSVSKVK